MKDFSCRACGCSEYHTKEIGDGKTTDKIIDLRNPKINARITLKACANCHIVFAYWEDFNTAADISDEEKQQAAEILAEGEKK